MPNLTPARAALAAALLTAPLAAQTNTVAGLDTFLSNTASPTYFGRRGAAHPNGEVAMSYSYTMCNSGSVVIPWLSANSGPNPMRTVHPKFAYMVVRDTGARMEQITDARTFVKHAFGAANSDGACGTCQNPGTNTAVGIGCSDTYGASTNANRFWLGPASEIDPWLGTWNPLNSYFDRGDPDVGFPQNQDGVRSLTSGTFADAVKNRVTLRESDLLLPGRFFYCMHLIVEGEDGDLRDDNLSHREMVPSWNGTTWSFANSGVPFTNGSVLAQWAGATLDVGRNGDDDGRFFVAVKATAPPGGLYHYEYAVHDFDNGRGAATLRIPVCSSTTVANVGFRDPNGDPLDDWTWSRVGDELVFQAPVGNALEWNHLYNFWFDCDAIPASGAVVLDQAHPGAGALSVTVPARVPAGPAAVVGMGPGCGAPAPSLAAVGLPVLGDVGFALQVGAAPGGAVLLVLAPVAAAAPLAPGCTQYVDAATLQVYGFFLADGSGAVQVPVPVPNDPLLDGRSVFWQAAEFLASGPVLGTFAVSNGVETVFGCR
ncbi:MAG: hypothetical protein AB7O97_02910 [Planctomycetota bacterium]